MVIAGATAAALEAARRRREEEERLKADIARKNAEAEAREAEQRHLAWLAGLAAAAAAAAKETKDQLFERRELRLEAMEMANQGRAETEAHEPLRAALPAPPDDQERIRVATAPRDLRQVAERRDQPLGRGPGPAPWWQRVGDWVAYNLGRGARVTRSTSDALALRHLRFNRLPDGHISVRASTPPGTRLDYRQLVRQRDFDFVGTRYNPETVAAHTAGGLLRKAVSRGSLVTAGVISLAQNLWAFGTNPQEGATFWDRTVENREFWVSTVVDFAVSVAVGVAAAAVVSAGVAVAGTLLSVSAPLWLAVGATAVVGVFIGYGLEALGISDWAKGLVNSWFPDG